MTNRYGVSPHFTITTLRFSYTDTRTRRTMIL